MPGKKEKLFFPVFIDLSESHIVVVGAGKIAARRIKTLLDFAGKITVIAPEIREEISESAESENLEIVRRQFAPADLDGADMVLAVTNDPALNRKIASLCREKGIPVNTGHDKGLCDFYFPGVVRKENLVIGITAGGKDHSLAKKVTEQIREMTEQ